MAERQTGSALFYGDAVTATGSTQLYPLGTRREEEGKTYRYIKYSNGAVSAVSGGLCGQKSPSDTVTEPTAWEVTCDISASHPDLVVGLLKSAPADGAFGWIQTAGVARLISNSDGNISKGDPLVWEAASDAGDCDQASNGTTERVCAIAAQDDDSTGATNPEQVYVLLILE